MESLLGLPGASPKLAAFSSPSPIVIPGEPPAKQAAREGNPGGKDGAGSIHLDPLPSRSLTFALAGDDSFTKGRQWRASPN
jgi:hypothetical protein